MVEAWKSNFTARFWVIFGAKVCLSNAFWEALAFDEALKG